MRCDDLRWSYSFLKIEVDLCFKLDLREVLDIRDFLRETTSALKLRFDCIDIVKIHRFFTIIRLIFAFIASVFI